MLLPNDQYELNKMNSTAAKVALGDKLHQQVGCLKGTYNFATQGGAVGDYNLKDSNGVSVTLPAKAIVQNVMVHVVTALTSGGSATIDLNLQSANDLLAAEAVASFSANAKIQGIPDFATLADAVITSATRTLTLSVNVAALNDGKINVFVYYVLSE